MILFYREENGDYLAIETTTNRYYLDTFRQDRFEGRATAIGGIDRLGLHNRYFEGFSSDEMQTGGEGRRAVRVAQGHRDGELNRTGAPEIVAAIMQSGTHERPHVHALGWRPR